VFAGAGDRDGPELVHPDPVVALLVGKAQFHIVGMRHRATPRAPGCNQGMSCEDRAPDAEIITHTL
jgi:hypothetical protein